MAASVTVRVNGVAAPAPDDDTRLLDWLRRDSGQPGGPGLRGAKEGCGSGHCGACTVLVDGRPVLACCTLTGAVPGAEVTTVEGLADTEVGGRLTAAFQEYGAIQCGFCTPGMMVSAYAAITRAGRPLSDLDARTALAGNVCRCTGYAAMVTAVTEASHG
jgi:aerobic-type carbon monoxide dehydrogenase small subunit (CoxS/CutS family)